MKKGSFPALLFRELLICRKSLISYLVMLLIFTPMPFLVILSFQHGNLALLPENIAVSIRSNNDIMLKLFAVTGTSMFGFAVSESSFFDADVKWDRFRKSTPVTPVRMALAKYTLQAIFTALSVVLSLGIGWLMNAVLGTPMSTEDTAVTLVLVAAIGVFGVLAQMFVMYFRSLDKGMMALMVCLAVAIVPFTTKLGRDSSGLDETARQQVIEKLQGLCVDIMPFIPVIIVGTLVIGFAATVLIYKRREK